MEFDTGAMITVLPRSAADILDLPLTEGYPLPLVGVGGARIQSYVHPVSVKVNGREFEIYIAFGTSELPPLLGRYTVFDQIGKIKLNNTQRRTEMEFIEMKPLPLLQMDEGQANRFAAASALISPGILYLLVAMLAKR